jgi:hypothetical protein
VVDLSMLLGIVERAIKIFGSIKSNLEGKPNEAVAKLAEVLEEISKIYEFVRVELIRYQTLCWHRLKFDLIELVLPESDCSPSI